MHWLWGVLSDPFLHQELVFDLGDPVRWEYLLLGTDKPFLSLTEEEDEGMNDDDDVENLVSLCGVGGLDTLSCFRPAWRTSPHRYVSRAGGAVQIDHL